MSGREESIGRWISTLYRIGQVYIANELEQFKTGKGQHAFLAALFHQDGISQGELAQILNMDKGAVAHAIKKLEQAGYVERKRDKDDRRVNLVYLTEKARNIEPTLSFVLSSWTDLLANGLTEEERRQILALLKRMSEKAAYGLEQKRQLPKLQQNSV